MVSIATLPRPCAGSSVHLFDAIGLVGIPCACGCGKVLASGEGPPVYVTSAAVPAFRADASATLADRILSALSALAATLGVSSRLPSLEGETDDDGRGYARRLLAGLDGAVVAPGVAVARVDGPSTELAVMFDGRPGTVCAWYVITLASEVLS